MKKIFTLMLMAMFAPLAMNAQTLTVCDGTESNEYVPFYGYYADDDQHNQMIFPATDLSAMNGKAITQMVFYIDPEGENGSYTTASRLGTWTVSLGETTATTLEDGLDETTALTQVYEGYFDCSSGTLTLAFEEDYLYNGGNLLVDLVHEAASYNHWFFLGVEAESAAYCYDDLFDFLPKTTFTYQAPPACPKPTNLIATTDGTTATVTWDGTAANDFIIDINGTSTPGATSPYTFNVALSTTYNISVTADCGGDGLSTPVTTSITTPDCIGGHTINYTLTDSYGDGWNGASITLIEGCEQTTLTCSGSSASGTLTICADYFAFVWNTGSYDSECGFTFTEGGTTLFTKPSSLSNGQVLYSFGTTTPIPTGLTAGTPGIDAVDLTWTAGGDETAWQLCVNDDEDNLILVEGRPSYTLTRLTPDTDYTVKVRAYIDASLQSCWSDAETFTTAEACARPTGLTEANITFTTADLSWTGTANSYVAEYGIWAQAGTDQIATATLDPYTFDLSGFSGKGTVAIRHYNVTDMFYLNVDDIVVKDANGDVVYSEDFESGSIPANISNIDLDGDGYMWTMGTNGLGQSNITVNGHYGLYSASWYNGTALNPDNWLVISDITLGGSITFKAVGQDPSVPYENFAVYVIADNQFTQAYSGTRTSCQVTGLTEGTAYAWRVQGDCGDYPSNWVFSMFKTPDNLLIFATNGNWDNPRNWTDTEGNTATTLPTADNKVRIDADAIIPAGVVATAKNAVLNGGSIEIEEGGQLKQGGTVKVTMHKGIEGYGAGNEEDADHYYFIATPHSCSYLEESDLFPYVLNVTDGNYDLYAFDPTADLEWINFESSSDHSEFHTGSNYGLFNKKGYLYANEADKDLIFVGTVSSSLNNILTESFTYSETSTDDFNGWRLVGNPYTCDAYISYVDDNGDVLEANFYTLNNSNTYSLMTSGQPLPPCTGALINYSATGKVQYATEAPAKRSGMLNMTVTQNRGMVDQARVRFGNGANLGKMSFRNSSKLYMTQGNKDYAVVYADNQGEMPVSFKAENNGTYTLSFSNENVEFSYLHLIDNMTGNDVNLLETPSYSFEAKTTDYESRFKLVFATGNANSDNFAYFADGSLVINNEGNATMNVYDVTGRLVNTQSINGSCQVSFNAASGVYMIQLVNGNDVKTQKIVVK